MTADPAACTGNAAAEVIADITGDHTTTGATAACGSWLASTASGGNSHSWNASPVPNRRRQGLRTAATTSTAAVNASSASQPRAVHAVTSASMLLIVELLQQFAQFGDVLLRQLALLGEVRHQGRHAAAEQAIEQALALLLHVLLARQQRRVEVAAAVAFGLHGLFLQQAVEQGLHRALLPALRGPDLGQDLLGRAR